MVEPNIAPAPNAALVFRKSRRLIPVFFFVIQSSGNIIAAF
jgi:hypothetical protein